MNVFVRLACVVPLLVVSACSTEKSDNPLSPSVAGPIAGVTISSPKPLQPAAGARINRSEPVVLTIENATTNGVRPLSYTYEGSTDASFSAQVLRQTGVEPGANGRTSLPVPGPLSAGQTYYWRVQATDGANSSEFSPTLHFVVVEPFILSAPAPLSPSGGQQTATLQPTLRTQNAARSGPAEGVTYRFEVSTSDQFGTLAFTASIPEQSDQTAITVSALQASTTYVWRVRAESASSTSDWSLPQVFTTPAPNVAPTPPPSGQLPPSNPGPRPGRVEGLAMVAAVIDDMRARGIPMSGDCGAFDIARRVAWAFRNRGAGLERKLGGRNCQGHSIDIIMFSDGMTVDVLVGGGVDNGPSWQEHGPFPELLGDWIAPTNPD